MSLLDVALLFLPLLDDRPPPDDLLRFPPASVIEQELRSNRLYREHLESRITVEHHQAWTIYTTLVETDHLYAMWDALRWARLYGDADNQRDMLKRLRELLGPCAYYAGRMPPALPLPRLVTIP